MNTRKPYNIQVRRMANGADYYATLWLKDQGDALDAMARKVRMFEPNVRREHLRVVDISEAREALKAR